MQLHLHPVWTYFDHPQWQARLAQVQPSDHLHSRTIEQLVGWMQRGIDVFGQWGVAAPVALRTGNLNVDRNVYRAMSQVGLKIASNVGLAIFEPRETELRLNAGIHRIEGITELPVLTYTDLASRRSSPRCIRCARARSPPSSPSAASPSTPRADRVRRP